MTLHPSLFNNCGLTYIVEMLSNADIDEPLVALIVILYGVQILNMGVLDANEYPQSDTIRQGNIFWRNM